MAHEITQLLQRIRDGESEASSELISKVYEELRQMARNKMANERSDHTLGATGLVHEAFLRLSNLHGFESRRHFYGAAAEAMRRILVDRARAKNTQKRGAGFDIDAQPVDEISLQDDPERRSTSPRIMELDAALARFEQVAKDKAELVKLRYFVGMTIKDAAKILGISTATADRQWAYAKAWLQAELERDS